MASKQETKSLAEVIINFQRAMVMEMAGQRVPWVAGASSAYECVNALLGNDHPFTVIIANFRLSRAFDHLPDSEVRRIADQVFSTYQSRGILFSTRGNEVQLAHAYSQLLTRLGTSDELARTLRTIYVRQRDLTYFCGDNGHAILSELVALQLRNNLRKEADATIQEYLHCISHRAPMIDSRYLNLPLQTLQQFGYGTAARQIADMNLESLRALGESTSVEVSFALQTIAELEVANKDFARACKLYSEAIEIQKNAREPMSDFQDRLNVITEKERQYGSTLREIQSRRKALVRLREAHAPATKVISALSDLAELEARASRDKDAENDLLEAIERCRQAGVPSALPRLLDLRAASLLKIGNYSLAEVDYLESLKIRRSLEPQPHAEIASSLSAIGQLRNYQGRFAEAVPIFAEAIEIQKGRVNASSEEISRFLRTSCGYSMALEQTGRLADAEKAITDSLSTARRIRGGKLGTAESEIIAMEYLGHFWLNRGHRAKAMSQFQELVAVTKHLRPSDLGYWRVADAKNQLAEIQNKWVWKGEMTTRVVQPASDP